MSLLSDFIINDEHAKDETLYVHSVKKIRDDSGYWEQVDIYIQKNSEADRSHSLCPECMEEHYPKEFMEIDLEKNGNNAE